MINKYEEDIIHIENAIKEVEKMNTCSTYIIDELKKELRCLKTLSNNTKEKKAI